MLVNGALQYWKPNENQNCIFLVADPIMHHMLSNWKPTWTFEDFYLEAKSHFPYLTDDRFKKGIYFDYLSLVYLYNNTHILIYSVYEIDDCVFQNLLLPTKISAITIKFSNYLFTKKSQTGSKSKNSLIAIDTNPEKFLSFVKYSKFLSKMWYKMNFMQTPNSFYYALDFGIQFNSKNIFFCGRNSDTYSWKDQVSKTGKFDYGYFFEPETESIEIASSGLLNHEINFSRSYIKMLQALFPRINILCVERDNLVFQEFLVDEDLAIACCYDA